MLLIKILLDEAAPPCVYGLVRVFPPLPDGAMPNPPPPLSITACPKTPSSLLALPPAKLVVYLTSFLCFAPWVWPSTLALLYFISLYL